MSWLDTLAEIRNTDWSTAEEAVRDGKAQEVVNICAYAAAVTAAVPIPAADIALVLPVHSAMVMTVGHIFGRSITQAEAKRIALELGAVAGLSFAGTAAISMLKKLLLPGLGSLLSIPAMFALTLGIGRAALSYFADPNLSRDDLKKVFEDAVKEGRATFSKEAFDRFRQSQNKNAPAPDAEEETEGFVARPPPSAPRPAESRAAESRPAETDDSLRPQKKRTL